MAGAGPVRDTRRAELNDRSRGILLNNTMFERRGITASVQQKGDW